MMTFFSKFRSRPLFLGFILTAVLLVNTSSSPDYFEISKNLDIFNAIYREINVTYVDGTQPGQLMKTGIDAMLASLDPYTNYFTENDIEDFRYMTTGEYGGIGATCNDMDGKIIVVDVYEGFAAQKAGIRPGDQIMGVNSLNVVGKKTDDIGNLLKGQAGTPVKLKVLHPGDASPVEISLNREEIRSKAVPYYGLLNPATGYIKLVSFTENCSGAVKDALVDLKQQGAKSLVLDLRGNLGGLLMEAVNIVNLFVEKGQEVVYTRGKVPAWDKSYQTVYPPVDKDIPLCVLVDENSASASEIVSGAIQDLDRGVIIGKRTYGKGLVQQTKELVYHAQVKITVAKYYIPSGRCVQALDYTHRDPEGRVEKVPDSLITAFKTKDGRIVYDGAGVMPDVLTAKQEVSNILFALVSRNHIFNFATEYSKKHATIAPVTSFHITDQEFNDFVNYTRDKDCSYTSKSEADLVSLKADAEKEKYFDDIRDEYDALSKKIDARKKDDLVKNKKEIVKYLEEEIISRYYYQKGRIEYSLRESSEVEQATKLLADPERHHKILTQVIPAKKPFNPGKKF